MANKIFGTSLVLVGTRTARNEYTSLKKIVKRSDQNHHRMRREIAGRMIDHMDRGLTVLLPSMIQPYKTQTPPIKNTAQIVDKKDAQFTSNDKQQRPITIDVNVKILPKSKFEKTVKFA